MRLGPTQHYFTVHPKCKKKAYKFTATILGHKLNFATASGIFSPRDIDTGSYTLMLHMDLKARQKILDLGCGYGAIGIVAAKLFKSSEIVMVDINERAVACAKNNIRLNDIKNAVAKQSYAFSGLKGEMFDVILLNPPQTAGLEICYSLIEGSFEHLKIGGSLQVVVRRRKGGERLSGRMEELFGNVEVLGKKAGYWVYKSTRTSEEKQIDKKETENKETENKETSE